MFFKFNYTIKFFIFCNIIRLYLSNKRRKKSHDKSRKGGVKVLTDGKNERINEKTLCAEYEAVYHYTLALCRDEALARDITQETFLKALNFSDKFKGDSSLFTWLCSIAKRQLINRYKKDKREIPTDDFGTIHTKNEKSPEEIISDKDMAFYIHTVLHKMDEPYKEVFSLRVFGQLSFADIAKLFSKTESWARVTYHRAKKAINEELRKDGIYE